MLDAVVVRSHPVRGVILGLLGERDLSAQCAAACPEVQAVMGHHISDQPSAVSYHFRRLRQASLITVAREEKRRGATKRFYTLTDRGRQLPAEAVTLDRIAAVLRSNLSLGEALQRLNALVAASGRDV